MRGGVVVFAGVAALLAAGAGRLGYIEYSQGARLRAQAARQQSAKMAIPAMRGEILDTRGRVLAGTVRRPSIYVDPSLVEDRRYAAHSIAPLLGLEPGWLEQLLLERRNRKFAWVKRGITEKELSAFKKVRGQRRLNAFVVRYEPRREYPYAALGRRLAAHVLGFVGAEQAGLAGIEQQYESRLKGTDGQRRTTVDSRRRPLRRHEDAYVAPLDGASIVLTIDAHIQERTEHHLRSAFERYDAEWGVAIVMDPQSGEVLAMATYPDFDPLVPIPAGLSGREREAAQERLRNRAVSDSYEPGSIFKPFIAAPAIEAGLSRLDESFAINGPAHRFGRRTIHDTHPYATLTLEDVIAKSSNIGMGLLAERCGNKRLFEFVRRFGFGEETGIALPGEHAGLVHDLANWTHYSTQSIPIGQELSITPIQTVSAFSVFCNGGLLYRPRIVRGIISASGETVLDASKPIVVRRVLAEQVAEEFRRRALVRVVTAGTGRGRHRAEIPDYQVFGKTGTAQVARSDGRGYLSNKYCGSFVGGAPSDRPRVVALVTIYKLSDKAYYGGTVAAPAVSAILADTLAYLQVPPELPADRPRGG